MLTGKIQIVRFPISVTIPTPKKIAIQLPIDWEMNLQRNSFF